MIEVLEFIFQSFWHFIGTLMLLGMLCQVVVALVTALVAVTTRH